MEPPPGYEKWEPEPFDQEKVERDLASFVELLFREGWRVVEDVEPRDDML